MNSRFAVTKPEDEKVSGTSSSSFNVVDPSKYTVTPAKKTRDKKVSRTSSSSFNVVDPSKYTVTPAKKPKEEVSYISDPSNFNIKPPEEPRPTIAERIKTGYENKWAIEDMDKLRSEIDPKTGKLPTLTTGEVLKDTPGSKYVPFMNAGPAIEDAWKIFQAAKRLEAGKNTPVDDYILAKAKAESERDKTFGAKVASILVEIPSFAGELALTGGIFNVVKSATQKATTKALETTAEKTARRKAVESFLTKSIGSTAGATAQTIPARHGYITAETIQNMTPEYEYQQGEGELFSAFISEEGDDVFEAAAKAFTNQWVEVVSEKSGGAFTMLAAPVKNKLLKMAMFKTLHKSNPELTTSKFMQLAKRAGWNGILEEMGEERVGEVMRGILTQVGLSEEGFTFPSANQLAVEFTAFSIMGGAIGTANRALQSQDGSFKDRTVSDSDEAAKQSFLDETYDNQLQKTNAQKQLEKEAPVSIKNYGDTILDVIDTYLNARSGESGIAPRTIQEDNGLETQITYSERTNLQGKTEYRLSFNTTNADGETIGVAGNIGKYGSDYLEWATKKKTGATKNQKTAETAKPGPGYKKLSKYFDEGVKLGTFRPEEATILKTLFENTADKYLNLLNLYHNGRLKRKSGYFSWIGLPRTDRRVREKGKDIFDIDRAGEHELHMQKGLATEKGLDGARVFLHEYGHSGYYMLLTDAERAIVDKVYKKLGQQGSKTMFESSLGSNPSYHARTVQEFMAQSFAEYVLENKVPAKQMEPLLKRLAKSFYEGLKRLANRGEISAMERLRPLYDKILAGEGVLGAQETGKRAESYKNELQELFSRLDKDKDSSVPSAPVQAPLFSGVKQPVPAQPAPAQPAPAQPSPVQPPTDVAEPPAKPEPVLPQQKETPPGKKIGWRDWFRTPKNVMRKLGVFEEYQALIHAYENYLKELPRNMEKIGRWSNRVSKDANSRIFDYLDGKKDTPLNQEEMQVATEIRAWLEQWADRLGLPKEARITDYITRIWPPKGEDHFPEDMEAAITGKRAKSIWNPFQLKRQGAEGYQRDTWAALDAYAKRATRKANIDPALEEFSEVADKLTEDSQAKYLEKRISTLNMRPTYMEKALDNDLNALLPNIGPRPTLRLTSWIRRVISRSKIAGSAVTFAKNLTQGINTWAELGNKYTMRGYRHLVQFGDKELVENAVLRDYFYEDKKYSAIKNWAKKFDKALFINMEASELINRGAAYYGAKSKFMDGKIKRKEYKQAFGREMPENHVPTEAEAIQYGKHVAEKTQFLFGPLETPQIMSGPIAKTMFQFQTFSLKQTEYGIQMLSDKEYAKFSRYLVGSSLLFHTIGSAFGMEWDESMRTFRWGFPPIISFMGDLYNEGVLGEDKYGNKLDAGERMEGVAESLWTNVVPLGAQSRRTVQGISAVAAGESRSKGGQLQYKIDRTPMNYVRAGLFGKGNLDEAQEYYDEKEEDKKPSSGKMRSSSF